MKYKRMNAAKPPPFLRRFAPAPRALMVVAATFAVGACGGVGQPRKAQAQSAMMDTRQKPDVQVVVMPGPEGKWIVSSVYPRKVSRADADARYKRLISVSGWKGSDVAFENKTLDRTPSNFKNGFAPLPVMSSLTFSTEATIVNWSTGVIEIEPFARAFRDLSRVHITYVVPGKFDFRGLREYSDKNVNVSLSGGDGAYTYIVTIKNHGADALGLPRYETLRANSPTRTADAARPKAGMTAKTRRVVGTGIVFLFAISAAALVYAVTQRAGAR